MRDTFPLLIKTDFPAIRRRPLDTLQANLGYRCNQSCLHCHVAAGPKRTEEMSWATMETLLAFAARQGIQTLDLTGGAPEMNPDFRWFVEQLSHRNKHIIVRCNLTIIVANPKYNDLPEFFKKHKKPVVNICLLRVLLFISKSNYLLSAIYFKISLAIFSGVNPNF